MASTPEQQHEHETTDELRDDLEYYRERAVQLEDIVTGVRAVVNVGRPDWRRRCENAAAALRRVLSLPDDRPGAWEAQHVSALDEPLRDVLAVLEGRRPVNVERLVELVIRALTAENQVGDVHRSHTVYRDRVAVTVVDVDVDGDRCTFCVSRGRRQPDTLQRS